MATNFNLTSYTPPSGNIVNFSFGTGIQTVNVDLKRQVVSTEIISTDTLRQVIAGIAQTINTDTLRQIVASESIQIDTKRNVSKNEIILADTLRTAYIGEVDTDDIAKLKFYSKVGNKCIFSSRVCNKLSFSSKVSDKIVFNAKVG